jgi:predicted nuclease with TOPRIM domain
MAFLIDNKQVILSIIDSWRGKLTYDALTKKVGLDLGLKRPPSRHTLLSCDELKHAYKLKKTELKAKKTDSIHETKILLESTDKLSALLKNIDDDDATIAALASRVDKLENENERLNTENRRLESQNNILLERFARWQHNLQKMDGVDLNKLAETIDTGLPAKNRG